MKKQVLFLCAYEIIINNSNDPQVFHLIINILQTMLLIYTVESQHFCYFSMRKGNKMVRNIICGLQSFLSPTVQQSGKTKDNLQHMQYRLIYINITVAIFATIQNLNSFIH